MLLVVFLLTVQLGPAAHLAAHRNDHTHGAGTTARAHAASHRAGVEHHHGAPDSLPDSTSDAGDRTPEHGRSSSAHFDLALIGGPPAPSLPLPAEQLVPLPEAVAPPPRPPSRPQPPVRGPPAPSSVPFTVSA